MEVTFDQATGLYRSGDLAVSTSLSDDLLATAYLRFKVEKSLETIYYENVPKIMDYLERALRPETICLGAFADRRESKIRKCRDFEFCGLAWVYDSQYMGNGMKKAEVGFGFFRHVATSDEKVQLGRMMVEALFSTHNIDVLLGTTPIDNQAALEYARRVGFGLHGPIPNYVSWEGALTDVKVSVLTKTAWRESQCDVAFLGPRIEEAASAQVA